MASDSRATPSHDMEVVFGDATVPVRVVRSARRRRTFAVAVESGVVVVRAPVRVSNAQVVEMLQARPAWVLKRLAAEATAPGPRAFVSGETVPYLGWALELVVVAGTNRRARVRLEGARLVVEPPKGTAEAVRAAVIAWYRARAVEILTEIAERWSAASGLVPKRVLVRDQKRRWGSCGPDGTVRLNWRLVMAEPALAEYVVVHELAHLRHKRHQAGFWDEVARLMPDHKERRRRLLAAAPGLVV